MRESICERRRSGVPSFYFTFPQNDASEHVILSAAGAKDLLFVRGDRTAWWSALRLESGPLTVGSNGHAVERSSLIVGSGGLSVVTNARAGGRRLLIAGSGPLTVVTDALT